MSRKGLVAAIVGALFGGGFFSLEILNWQVFKTVFLAVALAGGVLLFAGLAYGIVVMASWDDD